MKIKRILLSAILSAAAAASMAAAPEAPAQADSTATSEALVLELVERTDSATADSVAAPAPSPYDVWEERSVAFNPDPSRAVDVGPFPGLGQVYNRRYWKLPIIVGAYLGPATPRRGTTPCSPTTPAPTAT